jgi:Uma2 family endonuclease
MPAALSCDVPRKLWTREEAHALADLGFPNAEKLELIDGELIDRMGKKHPHVFWHHLVLAWLHAKFGEEYVRTESPIDVSTEDNPKSEPEPDLAVTARSIREYTTNPSPQELRLVIEISDSTLEYDLHVKAPIYARAEIVEYWVIDIPGRQVHVHRAPALGVYTSIVRYGFADNITPLAGADALFCMERL